MFSIWYEIKLFLGTLIAFIQYHYRKMEALFLNIYNLSLLLF